MPRYKLLLEYDGTPFVGWQRQANGPSVQAVIEDAVVALSGEERRIYGAGRTDTGVHALGQVAHVDLARRWPTDTIRDGLNAHMRDELVTVLAAEEVADDFNARTSAVRRHYLYRIRNIRPPAALDRWRVWHQPRHLDAAAMQEAAQRLLGTHDFTTFRAMACQARSPVKTLDALDVSARGDEIHVVAVARSFLHSQVRSMVGTLAKVGIGAWTPQQVTAALEARDRKACGPLAPPHGLYLARVDY